MNKKYELTDNIKVVDGHVLYQIKALKSFGDVKKGDLGGWIEDYSNLAQTDNSWDYESAKTDRSWVYEGAMVYENAEVCDGAKVHDYCQIYGDVTISDGVLVFGDLHIGGAGAFF